MSVTTNKKIPKWKDVEHLVKRGSLVKLVYDSEIYNLDRKFPGVEEVGFHIKDIGGNEIGAPVFHLKKPMDALRSIVASMITRKIPKDHPDAVDFKTFAGQVAHILDNHYEYIWDRYRDEQKIQYVNKGKSKVNEEKVRLFPTLDDDGNTRHVRIHEGLRGAVGDKQEQRHAPGAFMSYQVPEDSEDYNYIEVTKDGADTVKTKWRKLPMHAETRGYANTMADDPWLWVTMYMACYPEIFKTHTKAEHKFRVDIFNAVQQFILWGPQGEDGLKPGERYHPVREKMVPSLKQSDLIPANTRAEGRFNERGMHMSNGSDYEPEHAHGTLTDVEGTSAVEDKMREIDMEHYKHIEMLADNKYVRKFLMKRAPGEPRQFADQPLRAFGRYDLDNFVTSHLGMCVETDERYGNMNQTVMLKLDIDWDAIKYDGKPILEIRNKETLKKAIKNLLITRKNLGKVDSPVEMIHLKKSPKIVTAERAMEAGRHTQEDYELALRNRSKIRRNRNFMEAVMEVYEGDLPQMNALMDNPNILEDELMFNFIGRPNYFITNGSDGKARAIQQYSGRSERIRDERDEVYYHASLEWDRGSKLDNALRDLVRPHKIEWCEDSEIETELARYNKVLGKARAALKHYNERPNRGHLDRPDYSARSSDMGLLDEKTLQDDLTQQFNHMPTDEREAKITSRLKQERAKAHITQLRFEALWSEYTGKADFRFNDYSWKVDIKDKDGHTVPWDIYEKIEKHSRRRAWNDGEFDVELQRLPGTTTRRIARMMVESGELQQLIENFAHQIKALPQADDPDEAAQVQSARSDLKDKIKCLLEYRVMYEARATFMIHGNDNRDMEDHQHLTLRKARKQAHEMLQNLKMGKLHQAGIEDIGALEFMGDHKDEAELILTTYLAELERVEKELPPLSPTQMVMMGFDPDTGDELPYIHNVVHADKLVSLTLPDEHMAQTLSHEDIGCRFVIAELPDGMTRDHLQARLDDGDNLAMIGAESGEHRLAVKAKILNLWDSDQDDYFDDEMTALRLSYENSDMKLPKDRTRLVIIKMEDNPRIAGLRADGGRVDPNLQTINIPHDSGKNSFLAFFSPALGNVKEPTQGMIMRADHLKQDLQRGAVRLRETVLEEGNDADTLTGREIEHRIVKTMTVNMKKLLLAHDLLEHNESEELHHFDLDQARGEGFEDPAELKRYLDIMENHERYGYSTKRDLVDSAAGLYNTARHKVMDKPEKFSFTVVNFDKSLKPANLRRSMTYFDLYNRPHAALEGYTPMDRAYAMEQDNKPAETLRYAGAYEAQAPRPE